MPSPGLWEPTSPTLGPGCQPLLDPVTGPLAQLLGPEAGSAVSHDKASASSWVKQAEPPWDWGGPSLWAPTPSC